MKILLEKFLPEKMLHKYLRLFKNSLSSGIEYRGALLTWILVELISLCGILFIWTAVYRSNQTVGSYNIGNMILYYLLVPIIGSITSIFVSDRFPQQIKDGEISGDLLKPFSLPASVFIKNTGTRLIQQALKFPVYTLIIVILFHKFGFSVSASNILIALVLSLFAYLLHFFIDIALSCASFWIDDIWALSHLKFVVLLIFGGQSFPLDLVPKSFRTIFEILPFKFLYFVPIKIAQGSYGTDQIISLFIQLGLWLLFFYLIFRLVWKLGLRKYGAYGN